MPLAPRRCPCAQGARPPAQTEGQPIHREAGGRYLVAGGAGVLRTRGTYTSAPSWPAGPTRVGRVEFVPDSPVFVSWAAECVADNGAVISSGDEFEVATGHVQVDQALPELIWMEPRVVHLVIVRSGVHRQDVIT